MLLLLLRLCIALRVLMQAYLNGCSMYVLVPAEEGITLHGTEGREGCKPPVLLVLGTKLGASAKVAHAFVTAEPALQALSAGFFFFLIPLSKQSQVSAFVTFPSLSFEMPYLVLSSAVFLH